MDRGLLRIESPAPRIEPGSLVEFAASGRKSESLVSGMVTRVYDVNGRTYANVFAVIGFKGEFPLVPLDTLVRCSKKTSHFVFALIKGELAESIKKMSPFSVEKRLLKKAENELFQN